MARREGKKNGEGKNLYKITLTKPSPAGPPPPLPIPPAADWIRVLRLGIRALAAMDGGSRAEGELTTQETALYDRQIRLWGVDAQKRCAAAQELIPFTCIYYLCFRSL
jgi:hypothetical protein